MYVESTKYADVKQSSQHTFEENAASAQEMCVGGRRGEIRSLEAAAAVGIGESVID